VDLSKAAAREIGLLHHGVMDVVVAVVKMPGMDEPAATGIGGGQ
jgi:rare lipoprotein A (peptidoglycan hydrolase)